MCPKPCSHEVLTIGVISGIGYFHEIIFENPGVHIASTRGLLEEAFGRVPGCDWSVGQS